MRNSAAPADHQQLPEYDDDQFDTTIKSQVLG